MSEGFEVWAGLVELRPLPGNDTLGDHPGAFTNALTVAADAADFGTRVANFFLGEGFELISLERVETLADRGRLVPLPDGMRRLGELARASDDVHFDDYFAYGSTDA